MKQQQLEEQLRKNKLNYLSVVAFDLWLLQ